MMHRRRHHLAAMACCALASGCSGSATIGSAGDSPDASTGSGGDNAGMGGGAGDRSGGGMAGSAGGSAGANTSGAGGAGIGGAASGIGGAASGAGGGTGGGAVGMGGGTNGGQGGGAVTTGEPVIPPISGDCPTFASGTVTVGGLGGIVLQVGPKSQGGPLIFYWHGTGSSTAEVNLLIPAAVRQEIMSQGGIIVAFQNTLGTGGDCSGTRTFSIDDFNVADTIAACAVRDYGIDPHRIYTTGCSAGGLQAGCMGARRSSYIAATVPNSGGEVVQLPIQDATRVPAVMTMHGGAMDFVQVSFATTSARYDAQMKGAGSFVINCDHGGGHCQAPAALYSAGWEFMKAHPFGVKPEPYASGLPASFPTYCMPN